MARPLIGLVTTSNFRSIHKEELESFVLTYLPYLTSIGKVVATSGTYGVISETLKIHLPERAPELLNSITPLRSSSAGMVQIAHELVEGRLTCLFHLSHYKDINTTLASSVIRRQATLWNLLFTDSITGATRIIESWKSNAASLASLKRVQWTKNVVDCSRLTQHSKVNNLALIAHDGRKMDLMLFATQNLKQIVAFDVILATGTTGTWLKSFLNAAWPLLDPSVTAETVEQKVICCESGPKGGDVQIAEMALRGLCSRIIFFIDPLAAHPHEPDIKFFEMAIESVNNVKIQLATNAETAKYILT